VLSTYFVPSMLRLWQAETMPATEIEATVFWWVRLNHLRSLIGACALLAALKTLSVPSERSDNHK
jgi:hypothetical protein